MKIQSIRSVRFYPQFYIRKRRRFADVGANPYTTAYANLVRFYFTQYPHRFILQKSKNKVVQQSCLYNCVSFSSYTFMRIYGIGRMSENVDLLIVNI